MILKFWNTPINYRRSENAMSKYVFEQQQLGDHLTLDTIDKLPITRLLTG